jgi:hypothetical protein
MRIIAAEKKSEGVIFLDSFEYGRQVWTVVKIRKRNYCRICDKIFESKSVMYRPITNLSNRMVKYCASCMDKVILGIALINSQ